MRDENDDGNEANEIDGSLTGLGWVWALIHVLVIVAFIVVVATTPLTCLQRPVMTESRP